MTADDEGTGDPLSTGNMASASAWASSPTPSPQPSQQILDSVAAHGGLLLAALKNQAVPRRIRAGLAASSRGWDRSFALAELLDSEPAGRLLALAPAMTPGLLAQYARGLAHVGGWPRRAAEEARDQARLAEVMRAFTRSADPRCRALAAQAFPLSAAPRHQYAAGELSAPRLAADPDTAVRVALARNESIRRRPDDDVMQEVCRALLEDPEPRVRASARRAGLHVTAAQVNAILAVVYGGDPVDPSDQPPPAPDALDDPDPRVRATAVREGIAPLDGRRWARVLADASPVVRAAAATNGYRTPRWAWVRLAADPDARVRKAVARSRWTGPAVLRKLLSDSDETVAAAARARDPLRRPVKIALAGRQAPPGSGPLADLSRREQWLALQVSIAGLTHKQQAELAAAAAVNYSGRQEARHRMIGEAGSTPAARRLLLAWQQWGPMLGLTVRALAWDAPHEQLSLHYQRAATGGALLTRAVTGLTADTPLDAPAYRRYVAAARLYVDNYRQGAAPDVVDRMCRLLGGDDDLAEAIINAVPLGERSLAELPD